MPSTSKFLGPPGAVERLTPREHECLRLVAQHLSSKEIARQLGLSQHTVDGHLDEARRKLGAATRRDAVRILLEGASGAPPPNSGGQSPQDSAAPAGHPAAAAPPASGGQPPALAALHGEAPPRPATGHQDRGDELSGMAIPGAPTRLWQGIARLELTPAQRLAAIVLIAVVSALVLMLLLIGARELAFLVEQMTEGR